MPAKRGIEACCEWIYKTCCCCCKNKLDDELEEGSSESDDQELKDQLDTINKRFVASQQLTSSSRSDWVSNFFRDMPLTRVDVYFFWHSSWQNMYLGTKPGLNKLDYILYRFLYAIVSMGLLFYYLNLVTDKSTFTGMVYFQAWCFLVNAIYGGVYLLTLLREKFTGYRHTLVIVPVLEETGEDVDLHENAEKINQLRRNPVRSINRLFQFFWFLLNVYLTTVIASYLARATTSLMRFKEMELTMIVLGLHGVAILGIFVEVFVNRIPIRLAHFVYGVIFVHFYGIFVLALNLATTEEIYIYLTWKSRPLRSYAVILELSVYVIIAQILLHFLTLLREYVVYRIERAHQIRVARSAAEMRKRDKRRLHLRTLVDTCTSAELVKQVTNNILLFNEVMKELAENDEELNPIEDIQTQLREYEQNKKAHDMRAQIERRIQANVQKNIEGYTGADLEGGPTPAGSIAAPPGSKFVNFMQALMKTVRENREKRMEEARTKSSTMVRDKAEASATATDLTKNPSHRALYPQSTNATLKDYINAMQHKPQLPPIVVGKQKTKGSDMNIRMYDDLADPGREAENTFSGLTKKDLADMKERAAKKKSKENDHLSKSADKGTGTALQQPKPVDGKYPSLEEHSKKLASLPSTEYAKSNIFSDDDSSLDEEWNYGDPYDESRRKRRKDSTRSRRHSGPDSDPKRRKDSTGSRRHSGTESDSKQRKDSTGSRRRSGPESDPKLRKDNTRSRKHSEPESDFKRRKDSSDSRRHSGSEPDRKRNDITGSRRHSGSEPDRKRNDSTGSRRHTGSEPDRKRRGSTRRTHTEPQSSEKRRKDSIGSGKSSGDDSDTVTSLSSGYPTKRRRIPRILTNTEMDNYKEGEHKVILVKGRKVRPKSIPEYEIDLGPFLVPRMKPVIAPQRKWFTIDNVDLNNLVNTVASIGFVQPRRFPQNTGSMSGSFASQLSRSFTKEQIQAFRKAKRLREAYDNPNFESPSHPSSRGSLTTSKVYGSIKGSRAASHKSSRASSIKGSRVTSLQGSRAASVMGSRAASVQGSRAVLSLKGSRAPSHAQSLKSSRAPSAKGSQAYLTEQSVAPSTSKTGQQSVMDDLDALSEEVDTRILERIKEKQKNMDEVIDDEIKVAASLRLGGSNKQLSAELQKMRKFDWDLNIELHRYMVTQQHDRDKRLADEKLGKPLRSAREHVLITKPASSTNFPPIIEESLTEADKRDMLDKKGKGILKIRPPPVAKGKKGAQQKQQQQPQQSMTQFEKKAMRTQIRADGHGPMLDSHYHPLRAPAVQIAEAKTTYHFIDDKLPHSGGMNFVDMRDIGAYARHPGIHIHHPLLNMDDPHGTVEQAQRAHEEERLRWKEHPSKAAVAPQGIRYGEYRAKNASKIVAFHPIVQYHSLQDPPPTVTPSVTKEPRKDSVESEISVEDEQTKLPPKKSFWSKAE